ncbi:MAG: hypothetical protein AMJ89_06235 [candidate division Zixibacteria bacterium SM23_73]|nr:MAG: hypothetical protein AMJ89_06235 [candidate division Zixibacteria bacterium SM23_73]
MKKLSYLWFCILVLTWSSLLLSGCSSAKHVKKYDIEVKDDIRYFGNGYLEYKESIPFLHLEGGPYEVGLQYGVLLKDGVREVNDYKKELMAESQRWLPWYMKIFAKIFGGFYLSRKVGSLKKRVPQCYLDELRGISDGSGVPLEDILSTAFLFEMGGGGCSSFILKDDQRIVHARNFDLDIEFLAKHPVIIDYNVKDKLRYISVNCVGVPFILTGINEEGLSYSVNLVEASEPYDGKDFNLFLELNRIIESCKNLDEVDSVLKDIRLRSGWTLTIGSKMDNSGAVYDVLGDSFVRNDIKERDIYAANMFISTGMMRKHQSIHATDYWNTARIDKYKELSQKEKEHDIVERAIDVLSNTDFYHYNDRIPQMDATINNSMTLQSAVLDIDSNAIYFSYHPYYAGWSRWIKYDYETNDVTLYKEADQRLNHPDVINLVELFEKSQMLNWKKKSEMKEFATEIEKSGIENLLTLRLLYSLCNQTGDTAKAKEIADKIILKYPDVGVGYSYEGYLLKQKKNYHDAINYYQKALDAQINTDYEKARLYSELAFLYDLIGKRIESKAYATKAIDLYESYWVSDWLRKQINKLEDLLESQT